MVMRWGLGKHATGRRCGAGLVALFAFIALGTPDAAAHLFHFQNVSLKETQVSADYQLLVRLIDLGANRFDLAREVYQGRLRERIRRPSEPGLVVKAEYQKAIRAPSLEALAQRAEAKHGVALRERIEAALAARDVEGVKAAFRAFFLTQIADLLEAMEARLEDPTATRAGYAVLRYYFSTAFEFHMITRHRLRYFDARNALGDLEASLGSETFPPDSGAFARYRERLLLVLADAVRME